jgi:hypothetical protein
MTKSRRFPKKPAGGRWPITERENASRRNNRVALRFWFTEEEEEQTSFDFSGQLELKGKPLRCSKCGDEIPSGRLVCVPCALLQPPTHLLPEGDPDACPF